MLFKDAGHDVFLRSETSLIFEYGRKAMRDWQSLVLMSHVFMQLAVFA